MTNDGSQDENEEPGWWETVTQLLCSFFTSAHVQKFLQVGLIFDLILIALSEGLEAQAPKPTLNATATIDNDEIVEPNHEPTLKIVLLITGLAWGALALLLVAIVTYFEGGKPWKKPTFYIAIALCIAATICDSMELANIYMDQRCAILLGISKMITFFRVCQIQYELGQYETRKLKVELSAMVKKAPGEALSKDFVAINMDGGDLTQAPTITEDGTASAESPA